MSRNRRVVANLTAATLTVASALSGCGQHEESPAPATSAAKPSDLQPIDSVEAPDPRLADDPVVATVKGSVVRVEGTSPNCVLGGSGFVVAPNRVMTTADALAGGTTFTVEIAGQTLDSQVVSYDPERNLTVLAVPNLQAPPLSFAAEEAKGGSDAILLGYPEDADIATVPARIREVIELTGPDIYKTTTVSREVYTIRPAPRKGMSGGPLINLGGDVLGVAFGAAIDDSDTGFVLTAREIASRLADLSNTVPVAAGNELC